MLVQAIFFDFDGVLANTEDLHCEMFQKVFHELGVELSRSDYYEKYVGYDDRECFQKVLDANGKTPSDAEITDLIARKTKAFLAALEGRTFLYPGVYKVLQRLHGQFALAVVSGALRPEIEAILQNEKVRQYFRFIVAAEDCAKNKPDPEPYKKALQLLNQERAEQKKNPLPVGEVLVVEDSLLGIDAALAADMAVVAIEGTYPRNALKKALRVLPNIAQLGDAFFATL